MLNLELATKLSLALKYLEPPYSSACQHCFSFPSHIPIAN